MSTLCKNFLPSLILFLFLLLIATSFVSISRASGGVSISIKDVKVIEKDISYEIIVTCYFSWSLPSKYENGTIGADVFLDYKGSLSLEDLIKKAPISSLFVTEAPLVVDYLSGIPDVYPRSGDRTKSVKLEVPKVEGLQLSKLYVVARIYLYAGPIRIPGEVEESDDSSGFYAEDSDEAPVIISSGSSKTIAIAVGVALLTGLMIVKGRLAKKIPRGNLSAKTQEVRYTAKRGRSKVTKAKKRVKVKKSTKTAEIGKADILKKVNEVFEKYSFSYSLGENIYSVVSDRLIKNLDKSAKLVANKAKYWVNKWQDAVKNYDLVALEYKKELANVKIVGNNIVRLNPKKYLNVAKRYQKAKRLVDQARDNARRAWSQLAKVKRRSKIMGTVGDILSILDVGVDTIRNLCEGDNLIHAYTKSAASNYMCLKLTSRHPELTTYELATQLLLGDSEAGDIISASNFIKGPIQMAYDAAFKGSQVVYKRLLQGRYGLWYKYVYEAYLEMKEWAKLDVNILKEILDNEGLSAGLKGKVDNLGEFVDGVHQRIDEVFKVSKDSFKVTKIAVGVTKKSLHGLVNLGEGIVRTITSIKNVAKSATMTVKSWFGW